MPREYSHAGFSMAHQQKIDYFVAWFVTPWFERPKDELTLTALSQKIGISRQILYDWQRCDYFKAEVERLTKADVAHRIKNVKSALYQKACEGDVQAIKLFKEWEAGIVEEKTVNVKGKVDLKTLVAEVEDEETPDN